MVHYSINAGKLRPQKELGFSLSLKAAKSQHPRLKAVRKRNPSEFGGPAFLF